MAREAAHSRLLGGIHYRHDNEDGLNIGQRVARQIFEQKHEKTFTERSIENNDGVEP